MKFSHFFKASNGLAGSETLRRAVRATRRTAGESELSASARDRILDAARNQADQPGELFPSLFTAPRKLLLVGALPLMLAAGMLFLLNQSAPVVPDLGPATMHVSKEDGQVFFRMADGSRSHVVYRSTDPNRFERSSGVQVTGGSFTDALDDQADLVFYQFD